MGNEEFGNKETSKNGEFNFDSFDGDTNEKQITARNEKIKENIKGETNELLNKEVLINEAKVTIYEKLGINEKQNLNSSFENFTKGMIDEIVIGNYDMAIEVINTGGKVIIDALKQLASWKGIKQMAKALGESVLDLFIGNAYAKGKSVAELGLVTTGVGLGAMVGKKSLKFGIKRIAKLRLDKSKIVTSPKIKGHIQETVKKIDEIVPKKQFDFENMIIEDIAKLGDKDRIGAGKFYLGKKIDKIQEKAIIDAHNVGIDRPGAGIGNYNFAEIRQKNKILKNTGFKPDEIRILMKKGVCGKTVDVAVMPKLGVDFLEKKEVKKFLEEAKKLTSEQLQKSLDDLTIPDILQKQLEKIRISKVNNISDISSGLKFAQHPKGKKIIEKLETLDPDKILPYVEKKLTFPHNPKLSELIRREANRIKFIKEYTISDIKGLKPMQATKIIEEFAEKINLKYLINNQNIIDDVLEIAESMCSYIDNNIENILNINKKSFASFFGDFRELKRKFYTLSHADDVLPVNKIDVKEVYERVNDILLKLKQ